VIKLIVLDVDGVLTDGKIIYDSNGREYKSFNVKDGYGIKKAIERGIEVAVISGRRSVAVEKRCKELGVGWIFQSVEDKLSVLEKLLEELDLQLEEVAAMGDDVPDIEVLKRVGFSGAPADAVKEVKNIVNFISSRKGGEGAVREFIDYILEING